MIEPQVPAGLDALGVVRGVGIDVVDVERMGWTLERTPSFRTKVFTTAERATCDDRPDPAASYAGRFAAKEAVLKVLAEGIFSVRLTDIEVQGGVDDPPAIVVHGRAADLARARGVEQWLVSMSHDAGVAAAVVVGLGAAG